MHSYFFCLINCCFANTFSGLCCVLLYRMYDMYRCEILVPSLCTLCVFFFSCSHHDKGHIHHMSLHPEHADGSKDSVHLILLLVL